MSIQQPLERHRCATSKKNPIPNLQPKPVSPQNTIDFSLIRLRSSSPATPNKVSNLEKTSCHKFQQSGRLIPARKTRKETLKRDHPQLALPLQKPQNIRKHQKPNYPNFNTPTISAQTHQKAPQSHQISPSNTRKYHLTMNPSKGPDLSTQIPNHSNVERVSQRESQTFSYQPKSYITI